jgi:hypothetical protein
MISYREDFLVDHTIGLTLLPSQDPGVFPANLLMLEGDVRVANMSFEFKASIGPERAVGLGKSCSSTKILNDERDCIKTLLGYALVLRLVRPRDSEPLLIVSMQH